MERNYFGTLVSNQMVTQDKIINCVTLLLNYILFQFPFLLGSADNFHMDLLHQQGKTPTKEICTPLEQLQCI